jgi:hypothetical protein
MRWEEDFTAPILPCFQRENWGGNENLARHSRHFPEFSFGKDINRLWSGAFAHAPKTDLAKGQEGGLVRTAEMRIIKV